MKNDGGAAFPRTQWTGSDKNTAHRDIPGMTLRQWYKSQLASGGLSKQCLVEIYEHKDKPEEVKTVLAHFGEAIGDMADALIAEDMIAEDEAFAAREGKDE